MVYLEDHRLIKDHQYGFRHGRSTGDLLVYLIHRWAAAIESKGEGLAVSLDMAKAFDRVWHGALFDPLKTQVCALTTKKISFTASPVFQNTPLTVAPSISILGLNALSHCQYRDHLESKAKLASKKLGVINRARRYFTAKHRLAPYKAQVRPHMEYCFHLWAGALQYQLELFDRIQRRTIRIIEDPMIYKRLDTLTLRRER